MFYADIRHYLTDSGEVPDDLPQPAQNVLFRLTRIVSQVTVSLDADEGLPVETTEKCRRRPGRKPCPRQLWAGYTEEEPPRVWWECPRCGDSGVIAGWQGCHWDRHTTHREGGPPPPTPPMDGVPLSQLRGLGVYREDDLFDFARLWMELRALRDARLPKAGTAYCTIYGLVRDFARFIDLMDPDEQPVAEVVARAGLRPGAPIVPDDPRRR